MAALPIRMLAFRALWEPGKEQSGMFYVLFVLWENTLLLPCSLQQSARKFQKQPPALSVHLMLVMYLLLALKLVYLVAPKRSVVAMQGGVVLPMLQRVLRVFPGRIKLNLVLTPFANFVRLANGCFHL